MRRLLLERLLLSWLLLLEQLLLLERLLLGWLLSRRLLLCRLPRGEWWNRGRRRGRRLLLRKSGRGLCGNRGNWGNWSNWGNWENWRR
ncbi:MAG: hypothetical protein LBM04_11500 [Opitutaceae bacterium]|nr:hypothetical protein [Opitutaceae bacterium]